MSAFDVTTVSIDGRRAGKTLRSLLERTDKIAEIPNSLRRRTDVRLQSVRSSKVRYPVVSKLDDTTHNTELPNRISWRSP
jgi:hypothetical protein